MSLSNIKTSILDLVSKNCHEKFKDKEFNSGLDYIPVSGKVIDKTETILNQTFWIGAFPDLNNKNLYYGAESFKNFFKN